MKSFNFRGSRWNSIEAETNPYMKKEGYVVIRRPASYWIMKKQGGQMATGIDVRPEWLPKHIQSIAYKITSKY